MDRRTFLQAIGLGGLATLNSGMLLDALGSAPEGAFMPATAETRNPAAHVANRLAFGMTPALFDALGGADTAAINNWIAEQLQPERIDDSATDRMLEAFPLISERGGDLARDKQGMLGEVLTDLIGASVTRARYTERQLFERMVHFWSDHFSIYVRKGPTGFFKVDDDRDAIRPNALRTFRDLLHASATSPAMLYYLDNALSRNQAPNENYSRELLELHTLGVGGGYTEDDVKAVARCFTGWSITSGRDEAEPGRFIFRPRAHDNGEKVVLGETINTGGIGDGQRVLDMLSVHPSTARFVSTKLARRFVSDDPPADLVDRLATVFLDTGGDIIEIMNALLADDAFWNAPPKFKRPFEYMMGGLRALDYQTRAPMMLMRVVGEPLQAMGHVPFHWPAPDGYPDVASYWMGNLLPRWNLAIAMVLPQRQGGPNFDALTARVEARGLLNDSAATLAFLGEYLYGRPLTDAEFSTVQTFAAGISSEPSERLIAALTLMMAAPAYQYK
ncbi:MAG: DUF1800 domain-containing protein [Chloroflexota bacterium]